MQIKLRDPPSKPSREEIAKSARANLRPIKRILVSIDFSRGSLKAIPFALAISRQFRANISLLHVVDASQYLPPTVLMPFSPAEWSERLMKRLQGVAARYKADGRVLVLPPREGSAYKEICAAAGSENADLIVIATHGYTGLKHTFLGSTAERVVQHAPCPVLVVRQRFAHRLTGNGQRTATAFRLNRILVPTDFSKCASVAFKYAENLAREFKAELRLVHVIDPHAYPFGDEFAAVDAHRLINETQRSAQGLMREMLATARLRYSTRIERGSPAAEICNAANEDADLIVISTHGRTGLGPVLLGSVTKHVVRYARCPVLVIPARDAARNQDREP